MEINREERGRETRERHAGVKAQGWGAAGEREPQRAGGAEQSALGPCI